MALTTTNTKVEALAPAGLGDAGMALWDATAHASWLAPTDKMAVENVARLADVRAQLEQEIAERGVVLEEPIVSPTGKVVGTRLVANPAISSLCSVDRRMADHMQALGFSPKARAQLGLLVGTAERMQAEVDSFLARKYERGNE